MAALPVGFSKSTMVQEQLPELEHTLYSSAAPLNDTSTARIYSYCAFPTLGRDVTLNNAENMQYKFELPPKWWDFSSAEVEVTLQVRDAAGAILPDYDVDDPRTHIALQNCPIANIFKNVHVLDARGQTFDDITDGHQWRSLLLHLFEEPQVSNRMALITGFVPDSSAIDAGDPDDDERTESDAFADRADLIRSNTVTLRDRLPLTICDFRKPVHGKFQFVLTRAGNAMIFEKSAIANTAVAADPAAVPPEPGHNPNHTITLQEIKLWINYYQPQAGAAEVPTMQIVPHQAWTCNRYTLLAANQNRFVQSFISKRPPKLLLFVQTPNQATAALPVRTAMCTVMNNLKSLIVRIAGIQYPNIGYDFRNNSWSVIAANADNRDIIRPYLDLLRAHGKLDLPCNLDLTDFMRQYNIIAVDTSRTLGQFVETEGGETPVSIEMEWQAPANVVASDLLVFSIYNVIHAVDAFGNVTEMP
jgi:hypothetical protein